MAAALTVQERDGGKHPLRFVPYVPFDKGAFEQRAEVAE